MVRVFSPPSVDSS
ncbi:hypothetical protein DPMN_111875 [Dreissena polymorpha]|uniref:Uncharacterized protein n=1 Tax=Dreissena polymorpha TaxID=45954 RepID=A0A9D4KG07_DREPO|nr:hypothetical protein DPMN_111875 [Dreissena polymorpha]